jgi:serine/threonine protein kinase
MAEPTVTGEWSATPEAASPVPWPEIPNYEIRRELGRGGMGVVYLARQANSGRLVALKLIRDGDLATPQDRARFRVEADAAARVRHPNVVQIFEVGEHQGRPYFAMELLEGGSLDRRLAGQPQPPSSAARLVHTLALAIQHAHDQQVIHRDLKPANVLLAGSSRAHTIEESGVLHPDDPVDPVFDDTIPKITDFGLAKRLDSQSTALTRDGAVIGTASYMAPEQAAGRVHDLGPTVDVYALGAILYELLTGRPPFQSGSWHDTVEQVLHDEPALPTRLQSNVPRDLETICLKCLEKDSARRYATAAELADDLARFMAGQPVAAVPIDEHERLRRLAARDGYRITGEIGQGPLGTVYRALHGSMQQPLALKTYRVPCCSMEEWERLLRRSVEVHASITHPQLVPLQRGGWWDGVPFLVVEHLADTSLAEKRAGLLLPIREVLRLVHQLADLVSYLHRQGVVHGNLKPSNIFTAADGMIRVVDLHWTSGSHLVLRNVTGSSAWSRQPAGADSGSAGLEYLPPELLRNPETEPSFAADMYGLGVVLYELLTGRPPFAASSIEEVVMRVREQEPVPPAQLNPKVGSYLEAVCLRCLRKGPWHRYHRAYDLVTRLQCLLDRPEGRAMST